MSFEKLVKINNIFFLLVRSSTNEAYHEKVKDKVKYSLGQAQRDIEGFLMINPDITSNQLNTNQVEFRTFSFLPATDKLEDICQSCNEHIVFRDDLSKEKRQESLATQIQSDLAPQFTSEGDELPATFIHKLGLENNQPSDIPGLDLLLKVSARYVGLGALFPIKTLPQYNCKKEQKLQKIDSEARRNLDKLEKVLHLKPNQLS